MIKFDDIRSYDRNVGIGASDISKSRRAGQSDGKNNLPDENSTTPSQYEQNLIQNYANASKSLARSCQAGVEDLKRKIERTRYEIEEDLPRQAEQISNQQKEELDSVERQFGPRSAKFESLTIQHEEAKKTYQSVADLLKRPLQTQFKSVYMPFMICLAFAEVWVNRLAFELFFESNPIVSIALAIAVGAVLIFFAHISGAVAKKAQCEEINPPKAKMYWSLAALNLMVFVLALFLAKMREALISINEQSSASLESLLEDDLFGEGALDGLASENSSGLIDILSVGSMGQEGAFLLIINLVIYICGFLAAFYRHDSHPDYEKLTKDLEKKRVALSSVRTSYEAKQEEAARKYRKSLAFIEETKRSKESEVKEIEQTIIEIERSLQNKMEEGKIAVSKQMLAYREANIKSRTMTPPKYFTNEPESLLDDKLTRYGTD